MTANFFTHRQKYDGSWDSICLVCFATVSASRLEDGLAVTDDVHLCDAGTLTQRADDLQPLRRNANLLPMG